MVSLIYFNIFVFVYIIINIIFSHDKSYSAYTIIIYQVLFYEYNIDLFILYGDKMMENHKSESVVKKMKEQAPSQLIVGVSPHVRFHRQVGKYLFSGYLIRCKTFRHLKLQGVAFSSKVPIKIYVLGLCVIRLTALIIFHFKAF